jgi:hypothetical protein
VACGIISMPMLRSGFLSSFVGYLCLNTKHYARTAFWAYLGWGTHQKARIGAAVRD